MLQFVISSRAQRKMLALIEHYGAKKGGRIADAYDSLRQDLRAYPNLVPLEANGRDTGPPPR